MINFVNGWFNSLPQNQPREPQEPAVDPAEIERQRAYDAEQARQRLLEEQRERDEAEARRRAEEDARARELQGEMKGLDGDDAGDAMQFKGLDDAPGVAHPAGPDLGLKRGPGSSCEAVWDSCAGAMEANDAAMQSDYEIAADARHAIAKGQMDATLDVVGDAMKERGKGIIEPLKPEGGGGFLQSVGLKEKADGLAEKGADAAAEKGADAAGKRMKLTEEEESEKPQGGWKARWNKFIAETMKCRSVPDQESCNKRALAVLGKAKDKLKDYAGAAGQRANAAEEAMNKIVSRSLNRSMDAISKTAGCAAACR